MTVTKGGVNIITLEVVLNSTESSSEKIWAVHNPIKSWMLYNLTESELRLLILSLSVNELRSLRICKKNDKEWVVIQKDKHPDLFDKKRTDSYFIADGYASIDEVQENTGSDKEFFVIEPKKIQHPRLHQRFEVHVKCVIVGGDGKEFSTESIDISEGGFYFNETIPSWVAGYFLVVVDDRFQLMCSMVEDQKEKRRVQIVSEETDYNFVQYKNWLSTL